MKKEPSERLERSDTSGRVAVHPGGGMYKREDAKLPGRTTISLGSGARATLTSDIEARVAKAAAASKSEAKAVKASKAASAASQESRNPKHTANGSGAPTPGFIAAHEAAAKAHEAAAKAHEAHEAHGGEYMNRYGDKGKSADAVAFHRSEASDHRKTAEEAKQIASQSQAKAEAASAAALDATAHANKLHGSHFDPLAPRGSSAQQTVAHIEAARAHEAAAKAHEAHGGEYKTQYGDTGKSSDAAEYHRNQAEAHQRGAEIAAKGAGGDFDESKHPRGPDGKFA